MGVDPVTTAPLQPATDELPPTQPLHSGRPILPPGREETRGFSAVLTRPDFRKLWAAQAASQLADKFIMFTLLIVLYAISAHASLQSLLMVAYTFPSVFLSAPAGVYADRHDKRLLMVGTNVIRGLLVLLVPLAEAEPHLRGNPLPLLVITFAFSAVGQVFAPAEAASIPSLVSREQIMVATSLFMTTVIVTLIAGVPLATLTIRLFGQYAPFYIACGLFMVAAVFVGRMHTDLRAIPGKVAPERDMLRELREGVAIMRGHPILRLALGQLTLTIVVIFTIFALGPAYLRTVLYRPSADTYLVLVPATFGVVVTAVLLDRMTGKLSRQQIAIIAAGVAGVVLIGLGVGPGGLRAASLEGLVAPVAMILSTLVGCALGALMIPALTVLQELTTPETRGRIFGGIFAVINAAVALPLLLAGTMADLFGVDRVVTGIGVILLATGLLAEGFRRRLQTS